MTYHWYDFCGNLGVIMMLLAFFLLQAERVGGQAISYLLLNALGAILVLISLCYAFNLSAFVIETCWVMISAWGLYRRFKHRGGAAV